MQVLFFCGYLEGKEYSLETLVQRVEKPVKKQTFGSYLQEYIESLETKKRFGNEFRRGDIVKVFNPASFLTPRYRGVKNLYLLTPSSCATNISSKDLNWLFPRSSTVFLHKCYVICLFILQEIIASFSYSYICITSILKYFFYINF